MRADAEGPAQPVSSSTLDDEVHARYSVFYDAHYRRILRAAFNRVDDLDEAEDLTAEVFITAWRHRDDADMVFRLPWLYSTLRNHIGSEYRRRARAARRVERVGGELVDPDQFADSERSITVRRAIAVLDPIDRELIWLAYWDELPRDEIASILGYNSATLRVRLMRARRRLARALAHLDHTPATSTTAEGGER